MSRVVGTRQEFTGRLGRAVRAARVEHVALAADTLCDRAVDLVGRDLHEPDGLPVSATVSHFAGGLEQRVHANDPGAQERRGVKDRPIDMRLGSEVDDRVLVDHQLVDERGVGNITLDEPVAVARPGLRVEPFQVGQGAGVGELVEDGDVVVRLARAGGERTRCR